MTKNAASTGSAKAGTKAPKIDFTSAFKSLNKDATRKTADRFDLAEQIVARSPNALSGPGGGAKSASFDAGVLEVGKSYMVPISMIDPNPYGARHYYRAEDVDQVGESISKGGQKVAANGYVKPDGRVGLIEGGTRLRSAKSLGLETLEVKIEEPPENERELYKRSVQFHEERRDHTPIDTAVMYRRLLDAGVYQSQDELAADMRDRRGNQLSKQQVSMYLRIEKIPDRLRRQMIEHEQTSAFWTAYEISAIFSQDDYAVRAAEYDRIGEEVIKEIQDKGLGKMQAQALVSSKLKGPSTRQRGEAMTVKFGDKAGVIKTFENRGQLDFSIKGLSPEKLTLLRDGIEKLCQGQLPLAG